MNKNELKTSLFEEEVIRSQFRVGYYEFAEILLDDVLGTTRLALFVRATLIYVLVGSF
jgi:hypothetical protein